MTTPYPVANVGRLNSQDSSDSSPAAAHRRRHRARSRRRLRSGTSRQPIIEWGNSNAPFFTSSAFNPPSPPKLMSSKKMPYSRGLMRGPGRRRRRLTRRRRPDAERSSASAQSPRRPDPDQCTRSTASPGRRMCIRPPHKSRADDNLRAQRNLPRQKTKTRNHIRIAQPLIGQRAAGSARLAGGLRAVKTYLVIAHAYAAAGWPRHSSIRCA